MRLPAVVAAALLIASCSQAQPPAATGAPTAEATPAAATAASTPTSAAAGTAAATAAASPSGPTFGDLVKSGKLATYKVSYKWTASGSTDTFTQTWTFKPPKSRVDWTTTSGGTTSTFSIFEDGTKAYLCTTDGGQATCLETQGSGLEGQNQAFALQESFESDPNAFNSAFTETRTIAGQKAYCYTVGSAALGGSATSCYTQTGVPMLIEWKAGTEAWSMEATSFSASVSDADFALPATPIKLP